MAKPGSSAPTHRFTAPLAPPGPPAQRSAGTTAQATEEGAAADELRSARHYQFTAYEIASGLVAVSRGTSYAKAGQDVRERAARRWGTVARDAASRRHGTLVSDWVEVYAEALWQAQAPYAGTWPETVLVGALPLTAGGAAARGSAHKLAFAVFVAMSYRPGGGPEIFAIRSSSGTGAACWTAFLRGLAAERSGRPVRIVGDGSASLARAVDAVWARDAPQVWTDEAVLRAEARRVCRDRGLDRRDLRLWLLLQRAWRSPQDWECFTAEARRYRLPELDRWLAVAEPLTLRQFALRSTGVRLSRRAVPATLAELELRLGARRTAFGNQERTDRLLRLMALDLSGVARAHAWTDLICAWLERTGGRPASSQRAIADRGGRRSLRPADRRLLPAADSR